MGYCNEVQDKHTSAAVTFNTRQVNLEVED
jgi:hypothetical protein